MELLRMSYELRITHKDWQTGAMKKITVILALILLGVAMVGVGGAHISSGKVGAPLGSTDVGGKIAFVRDNQDAQHNQLGGAIWLYQNGNQSRLTQGPQDQQAKRDSMPAFSPDGTQLVYVRSDEGYSDLYKLDVADPGGTTAITDNRPPGEVGHFDPTGKNGWSDLALWALFPSFSPDGKSIAYTTDIGVEYPGLFLMSAGGKNIRRISSLDHSTQTVERPTWSPYGTKIAVANYVDTGGLGQIWILNLETGKWIHMTESKEGAYDPAWSPDGQWIAFTMRDGGASNIYVASADPSVWNGTTPTAYKLTTDGSSRTPTWSPDGSRLAYFSLKDSSFDLYAGQFVTDPNADPALANVQALTSGTNIDVAGGMSWGK